MYLAAAAKLMVPTTIEHLNTACCAPHFLVSSFASTLQQNSHCFVLTRVTSVNGNA
jgi:hypothetical protein